MEEGISFTNIPKNIKDSITSIFISGTLMIEGVIFARRCNEERQGFAKVLCTLYLRNPVAYVRPWHVSFPNESAHRSDLQLHAGSASSPTFDDVTFSSFLLLLLLFPLHPRWALLRVSGLASLTLTLPSENSPVVATLFESYPFLNLVEI